jgi:hypothetical protein
MSRAHDRAYHLLAERMRLRAPARHALYVLLAVLAASGVWWLLVHYEGEFVPEWQNELRRVALEAWAMKVHGAAAFITLIAVGAMLTNHVRRGWTLARNRASGATVLAAFALLTLTGYALYYLVADETRPPVSLAHWLAGLALVPLLVVHIAAGRRTRRPSSW